MSDIPFSYNPDNEQKLLAYYFAHPEASMGLTPDHFLHPMSQAVVKGIQESVTRKLDFNLDTIVALALKSNGSVTYKLLQDIQATHTDFTNIEFCKQTLVSDWAKYRGTSKLFEKISETLMSTGQVDPSILRNYAQEVSMLAGDIEANNVKALLTFADLVELHGQEIQERSLGQRIRSIGYRTLDRKLTAPGAVGQYLLAFGLTGSGKSVWLKNAELNMAMSGIPTLSFNLEMGNSGGRMGTAVMDLLVCIMGEFSMEQLYAKNMSPRLMARIQQTYSRLAAMQHYLFYGMESLSLDQYSSNISEAREVFRSRGVLPDDGYIMTTADLLSDFDDFGNEEKSLILQGVKKFDRIIKQQKVSAIALVQANENKIRGGKMFSEPDDLDRYRLGLEDLYGSSAWAKKARVVMSLHRPVFTKLRFFPSHPLVEQWQKEPDIVNVHVVKQSAGPLSFTQLIFDHKNMRMVPIKGKYDTDKD